ncbi:unnamed protein product [Prorocentrum cordatum]|uniref:Uncharacterized protein n=1 Tax=Prorocentrum cordatum TaxID=2364126 RepID=A0ABN9X100_9DINO|nr:unnamed protein product [Polarella glacialis]
MTQQPTAWVARRTPRARSRAGAAPQSWRWRAAGPEPVAVDTRKPMWHGRCALLGLAALEAVRLCAWLQSEGTSPGFSMVFGMHFLTTASDIACVVFALPLFVAGTAGSCVRLECLGPMLTLVFAMCSVDAGALAAYLIVATPRPVSPGSLRDSWWVRSLDALEANLGVWEFALVASVALQVALCISCWRIYRELRLAGLYPPGQDVGRARAKDVSLLEVLCEAEDVALLSECRMGGCCQAESAATLEVAATAEEPH